MIDQLKPSEKRHVYDLLRDAGMDVSDWSNYARPSSPASNPKYCYNWAFVESDQVVLCLWLEHMREDEHGIFQQLNYREISASSRQWSGPQRKRAREMDLAFQKAKNKQLEIHVIVVDGPPHADHEEGSTPVERRGLDPEPWHVEDYDDEGNCRLRRGPLPFSSPSHRTRDLRLARISYNSAEWKHPTGEAGGHESEETFNSLHQFGLEDWLFRDEWKIDGWRYAFIQGFNTEHGTYQNKVLDVTLYTVLPDKMRRLVGTIYGIEGLTADQSKDAEEAFKANGWYEKMKEEIRLVRGDPSALNNTDWTPHFLNVRFRSDEVDLYSHDTLLEEDGWIGDRRRYILYKMDNSSRQRVERGVGKRRGTSDVEPPTRLFRKGTKPLHYTPEHQKIQAKLVEELRQKYSKEAIICEEDFVDVRVETEDELIYFEIKTDLDPRRVIRHALGQLLEYAFYPAEKKKQPNQLVIVGRGPLIDSDVRYLEELRKKFNHPIRYRQIEP